MISFSGSLKVFLLVDCCDMRKGFNGLYGLVSSGFGEDPRSGALYLFCNRRHTRIKVLYFDGTGLWVLSKRLERGTFSWPKPSQVESPKAAGGKDRFTHPTPLRLQEREARCGPTGIFILCFCPKLVGDGCCQKHEPNQ
jgi:transposase